MGRRAKAQALGVWMNGERVGRWSVDARGTDHFDYDPDWLASPLGRPISLSMALAQRRYSGAVVAHFFDNLLPDSRIVRERMQQRFGVASQSPFDLLAQVGRDCVGALQLLPQDQTPGDMRRIEGEALDDARIETLLRNVPIAGRLQDDVDFRISLAGAQEKTALLLHDGRWMKPLGTTPSTHILKLPIGHHGGGIDLTTSVENEWLCARLLQAYGIAVANCWPARFGDQAVLVVERFDRRLSSDGKWLLRLPQEDLCQALGVGPAHKYESDGGPGIVTIMDLLLGSSVAAADREDFFRTQVVFWLLCAIDGHAKNFSVFIEPRGGYRLTPRYDVLSAYPVIGPGRNQIAEQKLKMAMALHGRNAHYRWHGIQRRHFIDMAKRCGFEAAGQRIVDELLAATPAVVDQVAATLPRRFPAQVAEAILVGVRTTAERMGG